MKTVYFDHNSTTPIDSRVLKRLSEVLEHFGNPSNQHHIGRRAHDLVRNARSEIARYLNVPPSRLFFTSGGTESNNLAIKGTVDYLHYSRRIPCSSIHIISTEIEHVCVLESLRDVARMGCRITFLPVGKSGIITIRDFERALRKTTRLATIILANNEIGTIQPVASLAKIARRNGVLFHTDAVQAPGKMAIDFGSLGVDMLSLSGHKIGAPKGIGLLYVKEGVHLLSQTVGGHQEDGLRAGTENTLGIITLGEAFRVLRGRNIEHSVKKMKKLKTMLYEGVRSIDGVRVNGHPDKSLCNTVSVTFKGIEASSLLMHLDLLGICASGGSACSETAFDTSHVLHAIGLSEEEANATVRFSLAESNTESEVRYLLKRLPAIVQKLRSISPSYREKTNGKARKTTRKR